ncbi:MAG: histidine phosphotransferase family protein [Alphaproteobacteria bacterium]|nr:histidine phosphotransferase family protein [Alphaproteobacteria bacterium]
MIHHDTRLAEMIATRLCHDLTGPIGAVNNGAEFLDEEGFDMQNEAVQLIVTSAHEAVNRLQFYRQAYGRVGESGEASLSDKKKIALDFFSGTKVKLDWPDSHTDASGVSISQKMSRLLLNLLIIAGASAIRGGVLSVRVAQSEQGEKQIDVTIVGETIRLDSDTAAILNDRAEEVTLSPKTAQPFLAAQLAEELHASIRFAVEGGTLSFRLTQPHLALANAS